MCVCSVHISGEEGEEVIIKEGVKDGGRSEKKGGLLSLHFVFGHVSDWYFLWLKEGGEGGGGGGGGLLSLYTAGMHMIHIWIRKCDN